MANCAQKREKKKEYHDVTNIRNAITMYVSIRNKELYLSMHEIEVRRI